MPPLDLANADPVQLVTITDFFIAALAWAATTLFGRTIATGTRERLRSILPLVAVLTAVACSAVLDAISGQPLTFQSLLHGAGAGFAAVFGHSQWREFMKRLEDDEFYNDITPKPPSGTVTALTLLLVLSSAPFLTGCANKVVRNLDSFIAEQVSALTRQELAADTLRDVAACIRDGGTWESCGLSCEGVVEPALRIDHRAEREAYRAIWLAGGNYPNADGTIPNERQPDPGAPGPFDAATVEAFCARKED